MLSNPSINSSENALVINLEQVRLEEIVEKKLLYFLNLSQPLGKDIFRIFYSVAEQALIELGLEKCNGNQLKAAKLLGINRNTLKKKIVAYDLDIKALLVKQKDLNYPINRIFLSSLSSLNLLEACRAKLALATTQNQIPKEKVLKQLGQPVEQKIIKTVLEYCNGNQIRASQFLGINRYTLKKKISLNLDVKVCS